MLIAMSENMEIIDVEMDGTDGLIVTFSDGTQGAYVVEELLELRPNREPAKRPTSSNALHGRHPNSALAERPQTLRPTC